MEISAGTPIKKPNLHKTARWDGSIPASRLPQAHLLCALGRERGAEPRDLGKPEQSHPECALGASRGRTGAKGSAARGRRAASRRRPDSLPGIWKNLQQQTPLKFRSGARRPRLPPRNALAGGRRTGGVESGGHGERAAAAAEALSHRRHRGPAAGWHGRQRRHGQLGPLVEIASQQQEEKQGSLGWSAASLPACPGGARAACAVQPGLD